MFFAILTSLGIIYGSYCLYVAGRVITGPTLTWQECWQWSRSTVVLLVGVILLSPIIGLIALIATLLGVNDDPDEPFSHRLQ